MSPLALMSTSMRAVLAVTLTIIVIAGLVMPSLKAHAFAPKPRNAQAKQPGKNNSQRQNSAQGEAANALAKMPISFEANEGQVDGKIKFFSRGNGYALLLTKTESILTLNRLSNAKGNNFADREQSEREAHAQHAVVRMKLVGANSNPLIEGRDQQPGKINYFIGNDRKKWRTGVRSYGKVKYHQVYPGIDLIYYGKGQQLEYDFVVAPGGDPSRIRLDFKGAKKLEIDAEGNLVLRTALGSVVHNKPTIYQVVNGMKEIVAGKYILKGKGQVGFRLGSYDRTNLLVIDPAIVYSTNLGGGLLSDGQFGRVLATSIAVHTDSNTGKTYAYVAGITEANGFPTKNPLQATGRTFVMKLDMAATGEASLVYSTFIGNHTGTSINFDFHNAAVAVDSAGNAYLTGNIQTNDLPLVNAFQAINKGPYYPEGEGCGPCPYGDAFVLKLNSAGNQIIYSSYLGGSGFDMARGIAADSAGNAYVIGHTSSANFPVVNAYQNSPGAGTTFVTKIVPPSGGSPAALVYSTYLGGSDGTAIAIDSGGNAYVTGIMNSSAFPFTSSAFKTTGTGFMAKLNPSVSGASSLAYSTGLGSVQPKGIAVDAAGNAYVTGVANTIDFTTTPGAFMTQTNATPFSVIGFATKIDPSKTGAASLVYATYLGGSDDPNNHFRLMAQSISVDASGNAFITGATSSPTFPLVNPIQSFSAGVFQSIDGGHSFTGLSNGLTNPFLTDLVVDSSTVPSTLYAGTRAGIFKSTDGGINWNAANGTGLSNNEIWCLAVNPLNPSRVYAGTAGGVFRTVDGGSTWTAVNSGLSESALSGPYLLSFDVVTMSGIATAVLYYGTNDGLYKMNDGSEAWSEIGLAPAVVNSLAVDTRTSPHTLYAGTDYGGKRIFKGIPRTDGTGSIDWTAITRLVYQSFGAPAIDTATTPSTLYAIDFDSSCAGSDPPLWKSSDGGDTWQQTTNNPGVLTDCFPRNRFLIDTTTTPSTIYLSDYEGGVAKGTEDEFGEINWTRIFNRGVTALAKNTTSAPAPPFPIYVGTSLEGTSSSDKGQDAFVAQLNSEGSALLFSTYLGGYHGDAALSVTVDFGGNILVVGFTQSSNFPTINAYQSDLHGNYSAFVTKLGSAALPSSSSGSVTTEVAVQTGKLQLSFPNITGSTSGTAPTTTVNQIDSTTAANLLLSNNLGAYEITTTATYNTSGYTADPTRGIKLTFTVQVVNDESVFNGLVITHGQDANADGVIQPTEMIPYNGTVDPNKITYHDFGTRTVWVYVPSLSPFVIVKGAPDQFGDLIKTVKSFNLKAGISNSLDAKLQNALKAYQASLAKDRVTACNQMAAFMSEVQAQTGKALTSAQANQLIGAARQIRLVSGCR